MLIAALLLLTAATGAGVVFARQPLRQVMALAINGLAMSLLFMALQAPDVAFSQIVVGTVAVPLMLLAALASMRMDRTPRGKRK